METNTGLIAVHVGAGYHSAANRDGYKDIVNKACLQGIALLLEKKTASEVAARMTAILEESPLTNAGVGSNLTLDGLIEGDASIMEGDSLHYAAVGAVPDIKNPIMVAYKLLEVQKAGLLSLGRIPPNTIVGSGARMWAKENDLDDLLCDTKSLVTENAQRIYNKYKQKLRRTSSPLCKRKRYDGTNKEEHVEDNIQDTVGVVCVDHAGHVAAAASSGGIVLKHPGRLGQAALYGCGCWAENCEGAGVALCTSGSGEHITKTMFARELALAMQGADNLPCSVSNAVNKKFLDSPFLRGISEKYGGMLAIKTDLDNHELEVEVIWAHSTQTMCLAYMSTVENKPNIVMSKLPEGKVPGNSFVVGSKQHYINR